MLTVTGTSSAGLNSTAQVRVTSDPKGDMGLGMLLDSVTEVGDGTANYDRKGNNHIRSCQIHTVISCKILIFVSNLKALNI